MSKNTMPLHKEAWIEELAVKIFNEIEALTKDKVGVARDSYGKGETKTINKMKDCEYWQSEALTFLLKQINALNML